MATKFSDTVKATADKPYILTHRESGERYAYSERQLARTRDLWRRVRTDLETVYTIVKEFNPNGN